MISNNYILAFATMSLVCTSFLYMLYLASCLIDFMHIVLIPRKPSIIKSRVKSSSSAVNHTEVSEILHLVVDDLDDRDQTVAAVVLPPSLLQPPDADTIQILVRQCMLD